MAHVVMVTSGLEKHAADWLRKHFDLQSYLPRVRYQRVVRGSLCNITEPLFRRYLFITNLYDQWRAVLETRGVLAFVCTGDEELGRIPAEMRDDDLIRIRNCEDAEGFINIEDPRIVRKPTQPAFVRDQRLRVTDGLMAGKIVYSTGFSIGNTEFVYFDMLGHSQRVEFDRSILVAAPEEEEQKRRRRRRHYSRDPLKRSAA